MFSKSATGEQCLRFRVLHNTRCHYPSLFCNSQLTMAHGSENDVISTLKSIIFTSHQIANMRGGSEDDMRSTSSSTSSESLVVVTFSDPPCIRPELLALGLDDGLVDELSQAFLTKAHQLRHFAQEAVGKVSNELAALPRTTGLRSVTDLRKDIVPVYNNIYLRGLEDWKRKVVNLAKSHISSSQTRTSPLRKARLPFNHVSSRIYKLFLRG